MRSVWNENWIKGKQDNKKQRKHLEHFDDKILLYTVVAEA